VPLTIAINPFNAAAFGALIISALLLLQWAHRRRPFILAWAAGWFALAPMSLALAQPFSSPAAANLAVGVSQLLRVATAVLFFWSADLYRQTQYVRRVSWRWSAGVAAWFVVTPMIVGPVTVQAPGYLLSSLLAAGAGTMYGAVLVERRMIGAGLVSFVLYGLAMANFAAGFAPGLTGAGTLGFQVFVLNAVLALFGALGVHLLVFEDMTYELRVTNRRLETAQQELVQAAITDPLTGCHNRRFLDQVAHRELQRHARFKLPLSLLFIDIDRFKAINDTLGHEAGDRVLMYVARFLKRHIREADYVFRWGGDEFLVLITCAEAAAVQKAATLKAAFDAAPETGDLPPGIGLSIGWTEVPAGTTDLMPLVHVADERMYEDKGRR
jgi:diguanylate cyclase (GGDEF)-like protein